MAELVECVRAQLGEWGLAGTIEGGQALDLAQRLTDEELRPAAAAMLHAQLNKVTADLRKLAPPAADEDDVADLQGEYQGLRAVR